MGEIVISVARDFTRHPGPRLIRQGPYSGEKFRVAVLVPALRANDRVLVDLDGTSGFGSSFLDEAFAGLIAYEGLSRAEVQRRVRIKSEDDTSLLTGTLESISRAVPSPEPA